MDFITTGQISASLFHRRYSYIEGKGYALSVIFVHNHPSGDTEASEDDIQLTRRLAEAGEIVGIDVLDHIIVGGKSYVSMKREGLF